MFISVDLGEQGALQCFGLELMETEMGLTDRV